MCALLHLFPHPGLLPDLSRLAFFGVFFFYITSLLKPLLTQPASCSLTFINRKADSAHICGQHVLCFVQCEFSVSFTVEDHITIHHVGALRVSSVCLTSLTGQRKHKAVKTQTALYVERKNAPFGVFILLFFVVQMRCCQHCLDSD